MTPSKSKTEATRSAAAESPPARILLVEDEAINRRFIRLALSKADVRVTTAENGQLGVELATSNHFDAILMDMQMPVVDGYQATRQLRQLGLTTPIIALTGHSTEADRKKCRQAGCTEHLTKPVDAAKLNETLTRCIAAAQSDNATGSGNPAEDRQDFGPEFRQIALDYLDVQGRRIREMSEALPRADFENLAQLAHRMKGTAGTVGFPQFTDPAERLVTAALTADVKDCAAAIETIVALQTEAAGTLGNPPATPAGTSPAPHRPDA